MDNLDCYRSLVQQTLEQIEQTRYSNGNYERELVIDRDRDRYLLMTLGWDGNKRVYYVVMHLDICNGKIWIQENRTNLDVAEALRRAGVPADHIVLGLVPPEERQYSDYAVA